MTPGPIATHAGAALAAAIIAAAGAWTAQGWRADAVLAQLQFDHERAAREANAEKIEMERTNAKKYQAAINAARADQARLAAAADAAAAESDGLRQLATDTARRFAAAPAPAVLDYATAASGLLADCSAEYQGMASKAGGHAGDVRTLMQAWPGD